MLSGEGEDMFVWLGMYDVLGWVVGEDELKRHSTVR